MPKPKAIEIGDKDVPLRDDIRLLGRILGDTVREQSGETVLAPSSTFAAGRVDRHDLVGDEPVKQMADRSEPLLDARRRELADYTSSIASRRSCSAVYTTRMTRWLFLASRVRDRDPLRLEPLSHTPVEFALNRPPAGIGAFDLTDDRHPGRADLVETP